MIKTKFLFLLWCFFISHSVLAAIPVQTITIDPQQVVPIATTASCLTGTLTLSNASNWYAQGTLTLTNQCATPTKVNNTIISFKSNSNNLSAMWGGVNRSASFTYQGDIARTTLIIANDPLPVGRQLILHFGINLTGTPFNLSAANSSLAIISSATTPTDGAIDLTVDPKGVVGVTTSAEINITGPGLAEPYVILNAKWTSPTLYKVTGLAYGTYTITAKPVGDLYLGMATPASVALNSNVPAKVTVTYAPTPATGALQINLSASPIAGLTQPVTARIINNTSQQTQVISVAWNAFTLVPNLPVGHNYTVTFPTVSNGISFSNPNPIAPPLILKNRTTPLTVSYQPAQLTPAVPVTFNVTGLPTTTQASIHIVDTFGNTFDKTGVKNGPTIQPLPINDSFAVSAKAPNAFATIAPASFILSKDTIPPAVSIKFTATPPPVSRAHFLAYADTGMQSARNGLVPPKGANMVEAFILYIPWKNKTDLWAITQGDAISEIIKNTPNTFASVGGANGPFPWDNEPVAKAVTEIEALIDYYGFIGLDWDVEGSALETPAVQKWVTEAVIQIKKDRPNLIQTLTVPDPVIGFTTGTMAILKQTLALNNQKMVFDWVNKMDFNQAGLGNGCTQTDPNMNNNCLVISATTGAQQLAILLNISTQQAYQYLGETFMVPVDDQGHPLSLALANQVATTLKNNGLIHMGYWRLQNDPNFSYANIFTKVLGLS